MDLEIAIKETRASIVVLVVIGTWQIAVEHRGAFAFILVRLHRRTRHSSSPGQRHAYYRYSLSVRLHTAWREFPQVGRRRWKPKARTTAWRAKILERGPGR